MADFSPNGRYLAYVGQSASTNVIYLRETNGLTVRPAPGTEGAIYAFFSPDSRWLGFLTNDKVRKVAIEGGAPVTLSDAQAPVSATWLRDDTIYFGQREGSLISRVSANGGTTTIVGPNVGPGIPLPPVWGTLSQVLPDGHAALLTGTGRGASADYADVLLASLPSLKTKVLLHSGYDARFVTPNLLVFGRSGSLFAVHFDPTRDEIQGEPFLVTPGVSMESFFSQAHFAASDNGLIAYVPGSDRAIGRLAWVDREGHAEFLPPPSQLFGVVDLSPTGDRLAVGVADVTDYIWVYDLRRNEGRRLTAGRPSQGAIWNPSGSVLTFTEWEAETQTFKVLAESADGGGARDLLTHRIADGPVFPSRWSPDERVLLLDGLDMLRDGKLERIPNAPVGAWFSAFSPDGRWVAFTLQGSGRSEIFIQSFPDGKTVRQISVDGGIEVRWCACGELFWRNGNRWMSSAIRTQPELAWDPPRTAFQTDFVDTPGISYDVSRDGKRLLIVKRPEPDDRSHIHLMTNWSQRAN